MRKTISILMKKRGTAAVVFLSVIAAMFIFLVNLQPESKSTTSTALERPVLVIDAGHGGIDGGAVGVDGSKESDINLAIALRLCAACDFFGLNSVMTRVDDSRGSDPLTYSEHAELVYRTELANSVENAVLMSIHQNCYPTAQPSGPQVLFSNNESSKRFGQLTHSNLVSKLDPENRRLAEPDNTNIYILQNARCPAILVECGFVSNHTDITKLSSGAYQTALSTVLMASFIQYTYDKSII